MRKINVLDTSTLILDPNSFKNFPDSDVIIPIAVFQELDKLKTQPNEAGRNARVAIRLLDELTSLDKLTSLGNPITGIQLENNSLLKINSQYFDNTRGFGPSDYGDTQILMSALSYSNKEDINLISNDINLRLKAKAHGINAESYHSDNISTLDVYSGVKIIEDEDLGMELSKNNVLEQDFDLLPNQAVIFKSSTDSVLGRKCHNGKTKLVRRSYPWGLTPKNKEQILAIDLLLDKNIDLVTITGIAGTGKSICILACALEQVLNKKEYDKLIIYRPIQPVGKDVGFLPGSLEEKLGPWFQAIMDGFEFLLGAKNSEWKKDLEMYQKKGRIELDAITFIRGRSIPNAIIFVDEAQNLSKEEIKTILTRAGEGSKIILSGDIEQIDNQDLDALDNGLTHTIEKFKTSDISAHITFTKGERSRLATVASQIL